MKIRTMERESWGRILEREDVLKPFSGDGFQGKISLLKMHKVREPLCREYGLKEVTIADDGYSWIQVGLEGQLFWLTAMFDDNDRLVQIYVDITGENVVDVEKPYFIDMYLDYVMVDEMVFELDRDELEEALRSGEITRVQYEEANAAGADVWRYLNENKLEVWRRVQGLIEIVK